MKWDISDWTCLPATNSKQEIKIYISPFTSSSLSPTVSVLLSFSMGKIIVCLFLLKCTWICCFGCKETLNKLRTIFHRNCWGCEKKGNFIISDLKVAFLEAATTISLRREIAREAPPAKILDNETSSMTDFLIKLFEKAFIQKATKALDILVTKGNKKHVVPTASEAALFPTSNKHRYCHLRWYHFHGYLYLSYWLAFLPSLTSNAPT